MAAGISGSPTLRETLDAEIAAGLVSVDDGGGFTFHESAQAALRDYEYPDEAASIFNARGEAFELFLDDDRRLGMQAAEAAPDLLWLRQAWAEAQRREPHRYPLRRFYATDDRTLFASIFESLVLERHGPAALRRLLAPAPVPAPDLAPVPAPGPHGPVPHGMVADPFGHVYRPTRLPHLFGRGRGEARLDRKSTIFVEVSATEP